MAFRLLDLDGGTVELTESIPPAYTERIGRELVCYLQDQR